MNGEPTLRRATAEDCRWLWELANDPDVRQLSFHPEPIAWAPHQAWFQTKLGSPGCGIWILLHDGRSVGRVRYDRTGDEAGIDLAVMPAFRGRGFGKALLQLSADRACQQLRVRRLVGIVKTSNIPSSRAFEAAGFRLAAEVSVQGEPCGRWQKECKATSLWPELH